MNRPILVILAAGIEGHLDVLRTMAGDNSVSDMELAVETLGRLSLIEAKIAHLRKTMQQDQSGRPDLHILGDRGDAA